MLDALAILARRLRPAAPVLAAAALLCFIAAVGLVLLDGGGRADAWLTLIIVLLLWSACGWLFIRIFATVPAAPSQGQRGLGLLLAWLNRAFHWLLAAAFAGTTVAAMLISARLVGDWAG